MHDGNLGRRLTRPLEGPLAQIAPVIEEVGLYRHVTAKALKTKRRLLIEQGPGHCSLVYLIDPSPEEEKQWEKARQLLSERLEKASARKAESNRRATANRERRRRSTIHDES